MAQLASELRESEHREPRPRGLAFRLLGSLRETESVVRQARGLPDAELARLCLDELRLRPAPPDEWHVPDLVVTPASEHTPEQLELLAGSTGAALFIALDRLPPDERVALVLSNGYGMAPDRISQVVGRPASEVVALADQASRSVGSPEVPDADLGAQRTVINAFYRATRSGDHEALLSILHPDAVAHIDAGDHAISAVVRGAEAMAQRGVMFGRVPSTTHHVLVNGAAGSVITAQGRVAVVMAFTIVGDRIVRMDGILEPLRVVTLGVESFQDL